MEVQSIKSYNTPQLILIHKKVSTVLTFSTVETFSFLQTKHNRRVQYLQSNTFINNPVQQVMGTLCPDAKQPEYEYEANHSAPIMLKLRICSIYFVLLFFFQFTKHVKSDGIKAVLHGG